MTRWVRTIITVVASDREIVLKTRVLRGGQTPFEDADWSSYTMEERINAVWELTRACLAWQVEDPSALRLDKSVTRVIRARR